RTTFAQAKRDVMLARALEEMPATRAALEKGEVSAAAANVLVQARETVTAQFESSEGSLVEAAKRLPVGALRAKIAEWVHTVDDESAEERAERQYERRRLDVAPASNGMVRMEGELDPETGCPIITALGVLVDASVRRGRDSRTPAQRRADAIAEICTGWLASRDRSGSEPD